VLRSVLEDVVNDLGCGCGGEGDDGRVAEPLACILEAYVGGAEVVAPLRDAVGFVDGLQAYAGLAQVIEEVVVLEPFRGDVDQLRNGVFDVLGYLGLLRAGEGGVDLFDGDVGVLCLGLLVLHERDEG
jgi:hypothetical protein